MDTIAPSLIGHALLVLIAALGALALWSYVLGNRAQLVIERFDSDGIIRLRGVHPDAGQAIAEAAAHGAAHGASSDDPTGRRAQTP